MAALTAEVEVGLLAAFAGLLLGLAGLCLAGLAGFLVCVAGLCVAAFAGFLLGFAVDLLGFLAFAGLLLFSFSFVAIILLLGAGDAAFVRVFVFLVGLLRGDS